MRQTRSSCSSAFTREEVAAGELHTQGGTAFVDSKCAAYAFIFAVDCETQKVLASRDKRGRVYFARILGNHTLCYFF